MSLMERYLRFLLRRRVVVLAVLVALTAASVWVLGRGVLATSLGALFLGDDPDYEVYKDRVLELGGDTVVLVGYEDEELLSRDSLDRLERATARIRAMPDVARVESLLDASRIHGADGMVRITRYAEEARRHPERAPALLADLTQDPLYRDLLVTADGRHAAVLVELPVDDSRPVEREPLIVEEVLQAFRDEGFPAERLHRTGIVSLMAELMHQAQLNLTRIFPATALVLLLVVWLMFRRLWPALITTGVGAISVLWTMALAVLLDPNINIMVALVPAVMLIVSFSDVIHLCSAYLLEAGRCPTRDEAILRAGVDVGRACYYTSITTFAGFISMIFIPAPVFRTLGIVLASGVAMALLLALTLTPVLFSLMPRPRAWKSEGSRVLRAVDSFLGVVRELTLARPWRVVALFAILGAAALAGSLAVTIDTSFEDRLRDDNPVSRDSAWFEERFSGAATLDLYVDAPEGGTLLEPGLLAAVARWQDRVEAEEGVDRALSLVTVLREIHRAMDPGRPPGELPEDPRRLADYMLLLEMSGDDVGLDRLVTHGRETLRVGVRLAQGTPVREAHALGRRLEALAADLLPAGVRIEASGSLVLTGRWLERIVDGQRRGLGFAFLSIL
ncbi:MAG: MMPL family transporter, partial [Deltaproteobacteria bacterium]|nr:MMPL family transporter [Deltaproteobacteria bacterium]